ncbi:hypothetical protein SAMN05421640_3762 [Ekhidna lutea]|uniref:Uncharacterized protein n=1 Tax=Ekhidna lutea TaxID=447679 RepID=A0A239MCD8_EKHLU|nr:hypothetical protein [Ekhidna lutea]SNT39698.1 hypothetical protein SAMN05421640_3762 [Ekhidna lutea]
MRTILIKLFSLATLILIVTMKANAQSYVELKEKAQLTCQLTSKELQERRETVITEIKKKIVSKTELEFGYIFFFTNSDACIDMLAEFIKTESKCCNFFSFKLELAPSSQLSLTLSGPEGTKEFIQMELGI